MEVGPISWGGLCVSCAKEHVCDNLEGIMSRSGEPFLKWRLAMAASVGAILPAESQPKE